MRKIASLLILQFIMAGYFPAMGQTPLLPRDAGIQGPQTFAIILGVSKYKFIKPLKYADKDAELFREYLRSPAGGSVKDENIFCLLNEKANNSNFWGKGFQWLKAKDLRKGDKLFIYLAGHGDAIDEDQFFFLGHDCNPAGDKNNYLVSGAIQLFNLKKKIAAETAKGVDVVFIMDACRSNELPGGTAGQNFLNSAISEKNAGEIIMLATGAGQEALEDAAIGNGHGLFTYYLVDGLNGLADSKNDPDNKISFREIQTYVDRNVPQVAQQLFKRKQDPYFCCSEKSDQIISRVDSIYLLNWLQRKKAAERTPGNSIIDRIIRGKKRSEIDTALINLYNRFNQAIQVNNSGGRNAAANYYNELERKFPGNPYTLDARSTLAVTYLDFAQQKVDEYLACNNSQRRDEIQEAGERLERAIELFRFDDEDFANSLLNRLHLLKASRDNSAAAFQHAYAAKNINPEGAYILNKLARMHLENNNKDSAAYYSNRAAVAAPNWPCVSIMSLPGISPGNKTNKSPGKQAVCKSGFGFTAGGGVSLSNPAYSGNSASGIVGVNSNTALTANLGFQYHACLGNTVNLRPTVTVIIENMNIDFSRRIQTGGPVTVETIAVKGTSFNIALPLIFRLSSKNIAPYFVFGPSYSYLVSQSSSSAEQIPVKKSLAMINGGLGVDIGLLRSGWIISPELKFSAGLSEMKDPAGTTIYAAALSSLKNNSISLNVYLRK